MFPGLRNAALLPLFRCLACSGGNPALRLIGSTSRTGDDSPTDMASVGLVERADAPIDARQQRSRRSLVDAMLALLREKPFEQVTIREIAARAGVGYATFFRHYSAKEALLGDVAAVEIAQMLARTTPLLYEVDSVESTRALCAWVDEHRTLWSTLLIGGAAGIVRAEFIRQARLLAQDKPPPDGWLPNDLAVVHGTASTIDVLAWWLEQDEDLPVARVAEILNRLVIAPLVGGRSRS